MRVTVENTAEDGGTYYSYWSTFNCNNTRLLAKTRRDGYASVYEFDPIQFRLGSLVSYCRILKLLRSLSMISARFDSV
jgi:hypothetical protein